MMQTENDEKSDLIFTNAVNNFISQHIKNNEKYTRDELNDFLQRQTDPESKIFVFTTGVLIQMDQNTYKDINDTCKLKVGGGQINEDSIICSFNNENVRKFLNSNKEILQNLVKTLNDTTEIQGDINYIEHFRLYLYNIFENIRKIFEYTNGFTGITELLFHHGLLKKTFLTIKGYILELQLFNDILLNEKLIQNYLKKTNENDTVPEFPDFVLKYISCKFISKKTNISTETKYNTIDNFATLINNAIRSKFGIIYNKYDAPKIQMKQELLQSFIDDMKKKAVDIKIRYIDLFINVIKDEETFLYFDDHENLYVNTTKNFTVTLTSQLKNINIDNTTINYLISSIKYKNEYGISRLNLNNTNMINIIENVKIIRDNYVPSKLLNNSILDYIYDREYIKDEDIRNKFQIIISNIKIVENELTKRNNYPSIVYAFHGTKHKIHPDSGIFTTYTFMSTTTSPVVPFEYIKGLTPYIYIFKLEKQNHTYIVFDDYLNQIMIPYGISFKVVQEENRKIDGTTYTFVFCEYNSIQKSILTVIDNGLSLGAEDFYNDLKVNSPEVTDKLERVSTETGSGIFYKTKNHFFKSLRIDKSINHTMRVLLVENLSSVIYDEVFNCKTQDYSLVLYDNNYCLKSKLNDSIMAYRESSYDAKHNRLKLHCQQLLVDLVMSNWDAFSNLNTILMEKQIFRVDVGNCLCYENRGYRKYDYFMSQQQPNDHIKWLEDNINYNSFITDTKKYFNSDSFISTNLSYLSKENKTKLENLFNLIINDKPDLTNISKKTIDFINLLNSFSKKHKEEYKFFIKKIIEILLKRFEYYQTNGRLVLQSLYNTSTATYGGSGHNIPDDDNTGITPIVVTSQQDFGYLGTQSGIEDFINRF